MAYTPSLRIKPQILVDAAITALEDELVISNTVTKRSDAKTFFASQGDTISQRVPGTLPVRTYTTRNDRSEPIRTDTYSESVVQVKISQDRPYSAVKLTDEQKDWDFNGWGPILDTQIESLGDYLEQGVLNQILNAPYERKLLIDTSDTNLAALKDKQQDVFFNAVVEAKSALRRMRTPDKTFTCLVGMSLAEELIKSNKLVKVLGIGDNALANDSIGTIAGVNFIPNVYVPDDQAYMYAGSGFLVFTGTPSIPQSVPYGATASANGWALRWLMDYDTGYLTDRSVFDCYAGYAYTRDYLKVVDQQGIGHISDEWYFVRGVQLGIKGGSLGTVDKKPGDGATDTPGGAVDSWLAKAYNHTYLATTMPDGEKYPLGGNFPLDPVAP